MITLTQKDLSELAGYTSRRLRDFDKELPEGKKLFVLRRDGKYDAAVFVQKWVDFCVARELAGIDDLDAVKAKHEIVKTQKTELEVARLRGQLIDVQDAKKLWGDIANTVMQNMLHLPNKVAPLLLMMDNVELIASIITDEMKRVLTAIADTPLPDYVGQDEQEEQEEQEDEET